MKKSGEKVWKWVEMFDMLNILCLGILISEENFLVKHSKLSSKLLLKR